MAGHVQGLTIEDLTEGMVAYFSKTVSEADIVLFAGVTGDTNPVHLDESYAATTAFGGRIAHGMLTAGLISAVIGTKLPGPGAIYMGQTLKFRAPVRIGDTVIAAVEVAAIDHTKKRVTLACRCSVNDKIVADGEALIMVPSRDG
ncbi:MAG: MaoC family dehydratase [Alphaproteobacteria bacterium]